MIDHGDDEELQNAIAAVNRYYQEHIYSEKQKGEPEIRRTESKENTEAKTEPAVESVVSETTETPDEKAESDSIKWDYSVLEDGTISLYGYETDQIPEVMEVPSTVDGKTVTEIDSLFLNEENIKKVILPSTINSIGPNAFRGSVWEEYANEIGYKFVAE